MKRLCAILCFCCTMCALKLSAQPPVPLNNPDYNRPQLFQFLPDTIPVDFNNLNSLLNYKEENLVSIELSNNTSFVFQGKVISVVSKYENRIKSIVIQSTNYPGARFTFSRVTHEDGLITYTGRIISFLHGDLYNLKKNGEQFILIKKGFYDVINE